MSGRPTHVIAPIPDGLLAPGTEAAAWVAACPAADLGAGSLRRITVGDLDVLLAATPEGLVAVDDRCPHMAAPLSLGALEGTVVACPLHSGTFDLRSGDCVQWPTTGGLGPDGEAHPVWTPAGKDPKPDPPGPKAEARRLTRIRRFRYYRVRVAGDTIEVAIP